MTCFCFTQCKKALDLLPGMKLNVLEVVSALLGKVLHQWKKPTRGKTLQFCFETRKVTKKTQKCVSCRQLSEENRGAVISIPIRWSNKRRYLCLQSTALPGVSREFAHSREFLPCCSLTQEGKNGLCFQLMSSARWLCSWRGYRVLWKWGVLYLGTCSTEWLQHTGQYFTQVAPTWSDTHTDCIMLCCLVLLPTDPPTAKGVLVSDHSQPESGWSSVTVVHPGSSSGGPSKSGGCKSRVSNISFQSSP